MVLEDGLVEDQASKSDMYEYQVRDTKKVSIYYNISIDRSFGAETPEIYWEAARREKLPATDQGGGGWG